MNPRDLLTVRFTRLLAATPRGRAHLLNQLADAEGQGENRVFDDLLAQVDDPELQKLISKHKADELRHEQLFLGCLERTGVARRPIPRELKLIERIEEALGGPQPVVDRRGVMEAYLLLQVLEERALAQFPLYERVFRTIDPETADTFVNIARDEERHLRYCHAISRRYAPDETTRVATLKRLREVEATQFAENSRANFSYAIEHGYVELGLVQRSLWGLLHAVGPRLGGLPYTSFAAAA